MIRGAVALVTGATGLIGGEMVEALARSGASRVWALARARTEAEARARTLHRIRRSGRWLPAEVLSVVEALRGDVTLPDLGLARTDCERIRRNVDFIVHCAAETSFRADGRCREINLGGMRQLVDLARRCERDPLIVHMGSASSSGIVPPGNLPERNGYGRRHVRHYNEYTRSKAEAEDRLRESGLRALVLRPSVVLSAGIPDPVFARAILWFVPLLNELERVPIDPASRIDLVTVDFVVKAAISLLCLTDRRFDCYHLSAGKAHSMTCGRLLDFVGSFYGRRRPLEAIPPVRWHASLGTGAGLTAREERVHDLIRLYLPFLNMDVVYDRSRLEAQLGERTPDLPPPTSYMGDLLDLISLEEAEIESRRP